MGYFVYEIRVFERMHVMKANILAFTFNGTLFFINIGAKGLKVFSETRIKTFE